VYALYWKRATKAGAYAGLLAGFVTEIALFFALGSARSPLAASIAILVPFAVVPLVSLRTKPPSKERLARSFAGS
jgi:SSS family solute:Na+ symporter